MTIAGRFFKNPARLLALLGATLPTRGRERTSAAFSTAAALALSFLVASPAFAQDLKVWKHGVVEAKSDASFAFMAARGGFAEKQGLKIEIIQFKGDALALKALIAGELDSYEGNPGGPMLAVSNRADLKIVGCYWPKLTYGLYAKPAITGPADFKGKVFAISSPGALPELFVRAVLEKNNIAQTDVKFSVMGSDADRFRAVTAGIVDVASSSSEFAPIAEKSGVRLFLNAADAVPMYPRFCTYASGKSIKDKPDLLVKYLAAQIGALRYALDHRDEAIALAKSVTEAKPDDPRAAYIYDEVKRYGAIDPDMPPATDKLAWLKELLTKTGNLTKPLDLAAMVDDGPRQKALAVVK